jgi:hypothetical protein
MEYKILSDKPIDSLTVKKVRDCLQQGRGQFATAFLQEFVDDFKSFDGKTVKIGDEGRFLEVLRLD